MISPFLFVNNVDYATLKKMKTIMITTEKKKNYNLQYPGPKITQPGHGPWSGI